MSRVHEANLSHWHSSQSFFDPRDQVNDRGSLQQRSRRDEAGRNARKRPHTVRNVLRRISVGAHASTPIVVDFAGALELLPKLRKEKRRILLFQFSFEMVFKSKECNEIFRRIKNPQERIHRKHSSSMHSFPMHLFSSEKESPKRRPSFLSISAFKSN